MRRSASAPTPRSAAARTPLGEPFVEAPLPPAPAMRNLIYLAQVQCVYCGTLLEPDATPSGGPESVVWRGCPDCGTTFYCDPPDEPAMRTRELMTYRPEQRSAGEHEAERRRRTLLANLSRRLNRLTDENDQARGFAFQDAVEKLFRIEGVPFEHGSRRGSREADGFVELDGWYFLVEIRWQRRPATLADLSAFRAKVRRASRQTMGLFLSMSGWTSGAGEVARSDGDQCVVLMDRSDIAAVLAGETRLATVLHQKARHLALFGEPHVRWSAAQAHADTRPAATNPRVGQRTSSRSPRRVAPPGE